MLKGNNKITTQTGNNPICTYSLNKFLSVMCQYTQPVERDNFALVRPHSQNIVSLKNNVSLGVATKTQISSVLYYVKNYFNWKQTTMHLKCSTSSSCLVYLLSQLCMCLQKHGSKCTNRPKREGFTRTSMGQSAPTDPKGKDSQGQAWVKVHQEAPKRRIKYKHGSKCTNRPKRVIETRW